MSSQCKIKQCSEDSNMNPAKNVHSVRRRIREKRKSGKHLCR